jgi:hypothetical protein
MIKYKQGDITIMILVIGVFAVCSLALLSFYYSDIKVKNSFVGIELMENINVEIEKYYFYKNLGIEDEEIKEIMNIIEDGEGKYLFEEKKEKYWEFSFDWRKERIIFSVKYDIP